MNKPYSLPVAHRVRSRRERRKETSFLVNLSRWEILPIFHGKEKKSVSNSFALASRKEKRNQNSCNRQAASYLQQKSPFHVGRKGKKREEALNLPTPFPKERSRRCR